MSTIVNGREGVIKKIEVKNKGEEGGGGKVVGTKKHDSSTRGQYRVWCKEAIDIGGV